MKGAKKTKKTPRKNTAFSNRPFHPIFKPPRASADVRREDCGESTPEDEGKDP